MYGPRVARIDFFVFHSLSYTSRSCELVSLHRGCRISVQCLFTSYQRWGLKNFHGIEGSSVKPDISACCKQSECEKDTRYHGDSDEHFIRSKIGAGFVLYNNCCQAHKVFDKENQKPIPNQ